MEYYNNITLKGIVIDDPRYSHTRDGVDYYKSRVKYYYIKGLLQLEGYVSVYFTSELITLHQIQEQSQVAITGYLINSRNNSHLTISVVALEVEVVPEVAHNELSYVYINGLVTKVFTSSDNFKGFVSFILSYSSADNTNLYSVRVVVWNKLAHKIFQNINTYNEVMIKGYLSQSTIPSDYTQISEINCTALIVTSYK